MELNKLMEKIIGQLLLDLEFRQTLLENPRLVLAQEGIPPLEIDRLMPHLKQLTNQQLNSINNNFAPLGPWTN